MMLVGYARAFDADPLADAQRRELARAGCTVVFADSDPSGASRRQLTAALASVREGDTLVVPSLNCLSRTLSSLIEVAHDLLTRGVGLHVLDEKISGFHPRDGASVSLLSALVSFERRALAERTKTGLELARRRGTKLGRRRKLNPEQVDLARRLIDAGESPANAARVVGVSTATLYRAIPGGASSRSTVDLLSELN
jgi:DNA invertase Pin-like site-specific DNA recombinase